MEQIDFDKFFYNLSLGWFYTEPVLFQVFLTHKLEKCSEMNCGIRSGQGKIQFNPEVLVNYSQKQIKDELKYELYRIMLRHPYRKKPYKADEELWFKASEITIKQIFLNTYGLEKNQSIEYYYEKLTGLQKDEESEGNDSESDEDVEEIKSDDEKSQDANDNADNNSRDQDESNNSDNSQSTSNENNNTCSDSSDEKSESSHDDSTSSADNDNNSIQKETTFSQTQLWGEEDLQSELQLESVLINIGGNWGSVPESIRKEVEKIQIKPVPQFVKILKSFRASVSFNQRQLTRMRPSRRSGFARMGSKYSLLPRILIAVDVSGSIWDEHMQTFFGAINQVFKSEIKGVDVIQFDAEVESKAIQFRKVPERITRLAQGGTNFQCVIDYAVQHNFYDGLVIFTDGGAVEPKVPDNLHASILWMTFVHAQKKDWMEKSGRVAWIYENNEVNWVRCQQEELL